MPASTGSQALSSGTGFRDPLLDLNREEELVTRSLAQKIENTGFYFFYLLSKNAKPRVRWVYLILWVEFFQLLGFVFAPYGTWDSMIRPLQGFLTIFAAFPERQTFMAYMFYLWASVAYSALALFLIIVALVKIWRSENAAIGTWLTRILLITVNGLVHMLYLPFLYIHASLYACDDESKIEILHFITDEEIKCWSTQHIIYILISAPFTLALILIVLSFSLFYFDSNPESKHLLSRTYSRVDAISSALKIGVVVCSVNFTSSKWISIIGLGVWAFSRFSLTLVFQPYYKKSINSLICSMSLGVLFATACLVLQLILPSSSLQLPAVIFYSGIIPVMYFGGVSVESRSDELRKVYSIAEEEQPRRNSNSSADQGQDQNSSTPLRGVAAIKSKLQFINPARLLCVLKLPTDVFIVARDIFFEDMKKNRTKQPSRETVDKVDSLFADAFEAFPESSLLIVAYMNCIFFHASLLDKFRIHADKLNQLQPFLDLRYIVYRKGRELEDQRQSTNAGSTSMDLASYIEFQTNYKAARKHHAEALKAIRRFWSLLLVEDDKFDLDQLPLAAKNITAATSAAQYHYESLIRRHPDAPRLFRSYAEFFLGTSHDSRKANAFLRKADELEDQQARRRAEENKRPTDLQTVGANIDMDDKTKSIITIDGKGIMQSMNHTATKMLQYSRAELTGNNVKMIMPSPYSENHDSYLANYHRTGIKKVLGSIRTLDAKKKNGELIPIRLAVHQTDVNGQVFFVGMIEKQEDNSCLLSVNADGSILSCNQIFVKRFGRDAREMVGRNFGEFFSTQPSDGELQPIRNFEETYGNSENTKLHARHGDGKWIQVIIAPKKQTKDGNAHFRCTFEFMDDIEIMITIDPYGTIRSCNHFVKHIFGYNRDELIDQKINLLMPAPYSYFHDTYLSTYSHTGVKNVIDRSRTVEGQHKDGSRFKVHLLVSEGEVNSSKMFSARISFAKKTEIPSCRFTITQTGVIQSHSESAVQLVGGSQTLVGITASKIFQFASASFEKESFMEIMAQQAGKGPLSAILLHRNSDGVVDHVDSSVEIALQELSGDTFFIVRLFTVDGSDVLFNLDSDGNVSNMNDVSVHLFGHYPNTFIGKPLFEYLRIKDTAKVNASFIESPELTDESGQPRTQTSENGLKPIELSSALHNRTNLIAIHRDGNQIPIYLELSATKTGYGCRIARKRMVVQHISLSSQSSSKFELKIENQAFVESDSANGDKSGSNANEEDRLLPSPKGRAKSPGAGSLGDEPSPGPSKKRVQIGQPGPDESEEQDASEDAGSSQHSDGQSGIRRIQRIRHKYQQDAHHNKSIERLKQKVGMAIFFLVLISMGLFIAIDTISKSQRITSFSIALCGNALSFHNSLYMLVDMIDSSTRCEPNCPWNVTLSKNQLLEDATMLENSLMSLYMTYSIENIYTGTMDYSDFDDVLPSYQAGNLKHHSFPNSKIKNYFTEPNLPITEFIDDREWVTQSPFIRAMRSYTYYARYLSTRDSWDDILERRYKYFILENGPNVLEQNWKDILDGYYDVAVNDENTFRWINILIVVAAISFILILGMFVIQPSFQLVHEERSQALKMFLLIPKSVVKTLSRIRITVESSESNSENSDNEEIDDDNGDEAGQQENGRSSKHRKSESIMDDSKKIYSIMKNRKMKDEKKRVQLDQAAEENKNAKKIKLPFYKRITLATVKEYFLKMRIRRHTRYWVSLLSVMSLGFAFVTIIGDQDITISHNNTRQVYFSSRLVNIAQDVTYSCIRLVDNTVPVATIQTKLTDSLSSYFSILHCITQGCPDQGIVRSDNDPNHANLFYSNRCFLRDSHECPREGSMLYQLSMSGLVNVASEIGLSASSISQRSSNYTFSDTDFYIVVNGEKDLLRKGLFTCTSLYAEEVKTHLQAIQEHQGAIAGATSGFMILSFFFFFRPMFNTLEEENRQTRAMLLMMPDEVVANTPEIEKFLIKTDL